MKATVVRLRDISSRHLEAWQDLASRSAEPNPFLGPDCLLPALCLPFGADIEIVFAEEGDRVHACVPVRSSWKWRGFPYPFITAEVVRTLECGTPLADPEHGTDGLATILTALVERRQTARSRVLVLPHVTRNGPTFEALRSAARMADVPFVVFESWERGFLARRPEPGYERLLNPKLQRELRRRRRRTAEVLGAEPVVVERSADPVAVERFLSLEASGYKGYARIAMATHPGETEYFGEICRRFAATDRLHLLALEAGDQTLAMCVWLRERDGFFLFKVAYDERYAQFGPGALIQMESMEYFHTATDAKWMDTCTYRDNEIILRHYADRREVAGIFVPLSRNPLDRMAVHSFMAVRPVHKKLYEIRNPYGLRAARRPGDGRVLADHSAR